MWSIEENKEKLHYTTSMQIFGDNELKLIRKLQAQPPDSTLKVQEVCPLHSFCTPFPLFRVHRIDEETFEAQWNDYHMAGVKQVFRFTDAV
jgi:hypothetical protein